ncbi:MAG TPA: hypothetical protein VM261_21245 [Kofleriaceae bacterium]|nr:hypothetical protein [Kofleriaceae bacterium]
MKLALAAAVLVVGCDARAQGSGSGSGSASAPAAPPAAQSPRPVVIPAGWVPLPEVADAGLAAAKDAARGRVTVVRSWGEPSLGCFATVVEIAGTRAEHAARIAESFRATLATDAQIEGWTFTDGPAAETTATLTRGAMKGSVRGRFAIDAAGVPSAAFAACFYNERDPARCQAACTGLLASLESPKVQP